MERCKEIQYLNMEMVQLVEYFHNMKISYQSCFDNWEEETEVYAKGLNCIFQSRVLECDNKLHLLGLLFNDNVPEEIRCFIPSTQRKCQSTLEHEFDSSEVETLNISEYYPADESDEESEVSAIQDSSDSDSEAIWEV